MSCPFAAVGFAVDLDKRAVIHQPAIRKHVNGGVASKTDQAVP